MPTFFRKVRKKLRTDNKLKKYFTYAIGEILLVVIGILIALQINNWNEERKEGIKTKGYVENIINDLHTDIQNIQNLMDHANKQTIAIDSFYVSMPQDRLNISSALDKALTLHTPFYRYFPVNQTFLDMQSSGNSALLSKTQRTALIELIYLQNRLEIANEKIIQIAMSEISGRNRHITERNDLHRIFDIESSKETVRNALLHQINYLDKMKDLAEVMNRFGEMIIMKSQEVIQLLSEQKNK